jgi:hypothetical protein
MKFGILLQQLEINSPNRRRQMGTFYRIVECDPDELEKKLTHLPNMIRDEFEITRRYRGDYNIEVMSVNVLSMPLLYPHD